ncbi:hypothetical protein [Mammaliicoccus sciuri]|uniref:hypothetical protein n=1 Tax=Mammaliicoccus sciuri TaxID=1296 RepID=UPI000E68882B|nr:hypothetical protein [Mammaliicoccus sciuri]RIN98777.1 hypothetical protein BU000_05100 [Mammaliicoccus sciuri]WRY64267.1 hypothetical protein P8F79_05465 [Mammaliicoccus sciuri]
MAYEHERWITHLIEHKLFTEGIDPKEETRAIDELKEVYAKAKILNKITDIVKTGRSLEDFEDVEVTLLAIEHELNYMLEGK